MVTLDNILPLFISQNFLLNSRYYFQRISPAFLVSILWENEQKIITFLGGCQSSWQKKTKKPSWLYFSKLTICLTSVGDVPHWEEIITPDFMEIYARMWAWLLVCTHNIYWCLQVCWNCSSMLMLTETKVDGKRKKYWFSLTSTEGTYSIAYHNANAKIETQYYKIVVWTQWCSHISIQFKEELLLFLPIGLESTKILSHKHLCTGSIFTTNSNQTFPLVSSHI